MSLLFFHPEPSTIKSKTRIWPAFIPFAGCPFRCVYCSQERATGADARPLEAIYADLENDLEQALARGTEPLELAFFGGTFTALPEPWPERFLSLAGEFRKKGLITRVRCSTRPDAVDPAMLRAMRAMGLDLVELGVQSFTDAALEASARKYGGNQAARACAIVAEAGLGLGVQLMPGMPGMKAVDFLADVDRAVAMKPECVRLYPCVVLEETPLAAMWRKGQYRPWSLGRTVPLLALALRRFWRADIQVIRMGLAPEPGLVEKMLDGPWHPGLGSMVRAHALYALIRTRAAALDKAPEALFVPGRHISDLWGHKREMEHLYARIGLSRNKIKAWDRPFFLLR